MWLTLLSLYHMVQDLWIVCYRSQTWIQL